MSTSPFEFVKAITSTKKDIMFDDIEEKAYNPFIVNRALSNYSDTVLFANEMNINHSIDKKLQFHFLMYTIPKSKRSSNWTKSVSPEDLQVVKDYYGYSDDKAKVALKLLSKENIDSMSKILSKGGRNSSRR